MEGEKFYFLKRPGNGYWTKELVLYGLDSNDHGSNFSPKVSSRVVLNPASRCKKLVLIIVA